MARLSITENKLVAKKIMDVLKDEWNQKNKKFQESEEFIKFKGDTERSAEMNGLAKLVEMKEELSTAEKKMEELLNIWKNAFGVTEYYFYPTRQSYNERLEKALEQFTNEKLGRFPTEDEVLAELILIGIDPSKNKFNELLQHIRKTFGI